MAAKALPHFAAQAPLPPRAELLFDEAASLAREFHIAHADQRGAAAGDQEGRAAVRFIAAEARLDQRADAPPVATDGGPADPFGDRREQDVAIGHAHVREERQRLIARPLPRRAGDRGDADGDVPSWRNERHRERSDERRRRARRGRGLGMGDGRGHGSSQGRGGEQRQQCQNSHHHPPQRSRFAMTQPEPFRNRCREDQAGSNTSLQTKAAARSPGRRLFRGSIRRAPEPGGLLLVQILARIGIGAVTARHDCTQRVVTGAAGIAR